MLVHLKGWGGGRVWYETRREWEGGGGGNEEGGGGEGEEEGVV